MTEPRPIGLACEQCGWIYEAGASVGQMCHCGGVVSEPTDPESFGVRRLVITAEWAGILILETLRSDLGFYRDEGEPPAFHQSVAIPPDVRVESVRYLGTTHRLEIWLGSTEWTGTGTLRVETIRRPDSRMRQTLLRVTEHKQ